MHAFSFPCRFRLLSRSGVRQDLDPVPKGDLWVDLLKDLEKRSGISKEFIRVSGIAIEGFSFGWLPDDVPLTVIPWPEFPRIVFVYADHLVRYPKSHGPLQLEALVETSLDESTVLDCQKQKALARALEAPPAPPACALQQPGQALILAKKDAVKRVFERDMREFTCRALALGYDTSGAGTTTLEQHAAMKLEDMKKEGHFYGSPLRFCIKYYAELDCGDHQGVAQIIEELERRELASPRPDLPEVMLEVFRSPDRRTHVGWFDLAGRLMLACMVHRVCEYEEPSDKYLELLLHLRAKQFQDKGLTQGSAVAALVLVYMSEREETKSAEAMGRLDSLASLDIFEKAKAGMFACRAGDNCEFFVGELCGFTGGCVNMMVVDALWNCVLTFRTMDEDEIREALPYVVETAFVDAHGGGTLGWCLCDALRCLLFMIAFTVNPRH